MRDRGKEFWPTIFVGAWLAVAAGGSIAFAITAVHLHSEAAQSAYVQQHGSNQTATVVRVQNSAYTDRYGNTTYTALITVRLTPPVNGEATAIVHDPARSDLVRGQTVDVLIDPRDPQYAEFAGMRYEAGGNWIALTVGAVIFGLFSVGVVAAIIRGLRHHRSHPGAHARLSRA